MSRLLSFTSSSEEEEAIGSGNNQGYIYSPQTLFYSGQSMDIKAQESFIIVPYQPQNWGVWKVYPAVYKGNDLKIRKKPKVFCVKITNQWLTKTIKLPRYTNLENLLATPGLQHQYSFLSFKDLNAHQVNDVNDNNDVDNDINIINDNLAPPAVPSPTPPLPCQCPCCLKSR
jgi:hypothetical protein